MSASKTVGFIGLGIMGKGMAMNLVKAGFTVNVWNRTKQTALDFASENKSVTVYDTPKDVVSNSEVTYACMATVDAAKAVVFGENGVLQGCQGKSYVDCSTVSAECSQKIGEAIIEAGGKYLEAPVSGSKVPAAQGALIFLCGGDKGVFDEILGGELNAMGKASHYLGETGQGARMKLVVNMVMGTMLGSLAEGMALAESAELDTSALLDVLANGAMANPMFGLKGPCMQKRAYPTNFPLKHQQKDMRLAIALGDDKKVSLPLAAAANESYKRAMGAGLGDEDFCAVFDVTKTK